MTKSVSSSICHQRWHCLVYTATYRRAEEAHMTNRQEGMQNLFSDVDQVNYDVE